MNTETPRMAKPETLAGVRASGDGGPLAKVRGGDSDGTYRPRQGTDRAAILAELRAGCKLTDKDAFDRFGCRRLAAVVNALRGMGYPIQRRMIEVPKRGGRVARVALYWIGAQ